MDSNIKQIVNVINGIGMLNFHYNSNGDSIEFDSNLKDLNSVTKQLEIELKNFMYLFNEQIRTTEIVSLNNMSDEFVIEASSSI